MRLFPGGFKVGGAWCVRGMKLRLLPSITILATPDEKGEDAEIIEDWAQGLAWVRWLLGSVRARMDGLSVVADGSAFKAAWRDFADGLFMETLGPALKEGWQAAQNGGLPALLELDARLSVELPGGVAKRSLRAGTVLLKSTRQARYQGVLGRLREAVEQGDSAGHLVTVWTAVAHFFQLSLASVVAEYLRLEWDIAVQRAGIGQSPDVRLEVIELTGRVMRDALSSHEPCVVRA